MLGSCLLFVGPFTSPAFAGGHVLAQHSRVVSTPSQRQTPFALQGFRLTGTGSRALASGGGANIVTAQQLPLWIDGFDLDSDAPSGTVDAVTHPHDVYQFFLEKGAVIDFYLNPMTTGSQVALKIFDPSATDVTADTPVLADMSYAYPHDIDYTAPEAGFYSVDVDAVNGASFYTLEYWWGHNNDEIPGVPITASPVIGTMQDPWNWDDVHRFPLKKGDRLSLSLSPVANSFDTANFDVDLFLDGPSTTSVAPWDSTNSGIVAHSAHSAPAVESITYKAPKSGTYYADVNDYSGQGVSALSWSVNPVRPGIARVPSGAKLSAKAGSSIALGATFTDQFHVALPAYSVYLQSSSNNKTWKNFKHLTTAPNGRVGVAVTSKKKGVVYVRWARLKTSTNAATYSASQKLTYK